MSLRQLVWLLVVVCVGFAAWQLLRALIVARRAPPRATSAPAVTVVDDEGAEDDGFDYAPELRPRPVTPPPAAPQAASDAVVERSADTFQLELESRHLRREVAELRALVSRQHAEIDALQLEVAGLRTQLEDAGASASGVSPEYSESLRLAEQGMAAEEIAARCGITVAEAELVLSLARSGGAPR
ncbi:DUF2802 domain-containing protein [Thauera sp. 63]|uniref:DUF2802 domain-containing protein n=1 Tax=Thauera sp. 63 TaxID=497321 RepID=UPI0002D06764|nr:DUF2802 domain-containing protein [Thauera sp. 63]ENO79423.1 hypothetical protein C664_04137 [Thauera sp. 63]